MPHIIKKQIINLALPKKSDAFRLQQKVSEHYTQDVVPLMENVFDELSGKEEIIQIDRLEIDLGLVSEKEVNQGHWDDAILSKIRDQLYKQIGRTAEGKNIKREAEALSICRQWLFYMQKGYLPWNVLQVSDAWYAKVLETLAVDFASVSELRNMIIHHPAVSRRIVSQHSENFLQQLVTILTAEKQHDLPEVVRQLSQILIWIGKEGLSLMDQKSGIKKIWEQLMKLSAQPEKKLTPLRFAEKILEKYVSDSAILETIIVTHSTELQLILPVLKKILETKDVPLAKQSTDSIATDTAEKKQAIEELSTIDEEGVFVQNAGVVLVHPFLPALFKRLQCVKEGKFTDSDSQQKSLCLINYLATGNVKAEEHQLTVAKILCNWPLAMPVEKDIELSKDELSEAENMLQALIEQWEVLKNTSPDGLRDGFLQRRGKFFTRNDRLYLRVENASLDVLLDQLPWNLNMIKLPWMKEILWVEWR